MTKFTVARTLTASLGTFAVLFLTSASVTAQTAYRPSATVGKWDGTFFFGTFVDSDSDSRLTALGQASASASGGSAVARSARGAVGESANVSLAAGPDGNGVSSNARAGVSNDFTLRLDPSFADEAQSHGGAAYLLINWALDGQNNNALNSPNGSSSTTASFNGSFNAYSGVGSVEKRIRSESSLTSVFLGGGYITRSGGTALDATSGALRLNLALLEEQTVSFVINAEASAYASLTPGASASSSADFGHTFYWNGISGVQFADGTMYGGFKSALGSDNYNFMTSSVPEPHVGLLVLSGLGLLGVVRRRKS